VCEPDWFPETKTQKGREEHADNSGRERTPGGGCRRTLQSLQRPLHVEPSREKNEGWTVSTLKRASEKREKKPGGGAKG